MTRLWANTTLIAAFMVAQTSIMNANAFADTSAVQIRINNTLTTQQSLSYRNTDNRLQMAACRTYTECNTGQLRCDRNGRNCQPVCRQVTKCD